MPRVLTAKDPGSQGLTLWVDGRAIGHVIAFNVDTREARVASGEVIKIDEIRAVPGFDLANILGSAKKGKF